jgi:sugar phosphate isomerase/epimerase
MQAGLVSVTFRQLSTADVIKLAVKAGLDCIEWSGDIHCPPNETESIKETARLTRENGLKAVSYGSYYYAGKGEDFTPMVNAATALQTGTIRIWPGCDWKGSADTGAEMRGKVVADIQNAADKAAAMGMKIALEYHADTLTDTLPSTLRLFEEVERDNLFTYWQPPKGLTAEENANALRQLVKANRLLNVHTHFWRGETQLPLSDGGEEWRRYIQAASPAAPAFLIEFVKGGEPEQFMEDAKTLKEWIRHV